MRIPVAVAVSVAALATLATACNDSETVDLVFRAPAGTRIAYRIDIEASVVTELAGPPNETRDRIALEAEQLVIGRAGSETQLQITMTRAGERPRVFEVRLDAGRGVAEVDAVEGLPVEALGELGPSRLILLASGLLPTRPLRPGSAWDIERALELPEGEQRLSGTGRLEGLRVDGGIELARVRATTSLPVSRTLDLPEGRVRLTGTERTTALLDYGVADGSVHGARSVTTGRFDLTVEPPSGEVLGPLRGELEVRVESRTTRAEPDQPVVEVVPEAPA